MLDGGALFFGILGVDKQKIVLHILLIDRGGALSYPTCEDVGHNCAGKALHVYALVFVKASVLNGNEGVLSGLADLIWRDLVAALGEHPRHWVTVLIGDGGDPGGGPIGELREVGLHRRIHTVDGGAADPRNGGKGEHSGETRGNDADKNFS